jgi:hypothetical protein
MTGCFRGCRTDHEWRLTSPRAPWDAFVPAVSHRAGRSWSNIPNPSNRDVAVVVDAPGTVQPGQSGNEMETALVTATTSNLLGLSAAWLQAAQERARCLAGRRQGIGARLPDL